MTAAATAAAASLPREVEALFSGETGGGSYFVSNYPPFSYWTPAAVRPEPAAFGEAPEPGVPFGVYVHVPFCRQRCHFCYFKVYTGRNAKEVSEYVAALGREAALLRERPAFRDRRASFLYVGGGTPSYLSVREVTRLRKLLSGLAAFDSLEELTFECEPGTITPAKLAALRDLGVTRLSLGVESFDDRVLQDNHRAHLERHVHAAYTAARQAGLPQVNLDLICGMAGETEEVWERNVRETIALGPDSVTIYPLELPANTTFYRAMEGGTRIPVPSWPEKRRRMSEAFDALEGAGYTLTSGVTAVRDPARTRFVYRDSLWGGADLAALGVSAFGHVAGTHVQNEKRIEDYSARLDRGELPLQRGYVMTADERLVRQVVLQLKTGRVLRAPVRARFGVDPALRFEEPFAALAAAGLLAIDGEAIRLTRDALLQVDRLLPLLYRPEHRLHA